MYYLYALEEPLSMIYHVANEFAAVEETEVGFSSK